MAPYKLSFIIIIIIIIIKYKTFLNFVYKHYLRKTFERIQLPATPTGLFIPLDLLS